MWLAARCIEKTGAKTQTLAKLIKLKEEKATEAPGNKKVVACAREKLLNRYSIARGFRDVWWEGEEGIAFKQDSRMGGGGRGVLPGELPRRGREQCPPRPLQTRHSAALKTNKSRWVIKRNCWSLAPFIHAPIINFRSLMSSNSQLQIAERGKPNRSSRRRGAGTARWQPLEPSGAARSTRKSRWRHYQISRKISSMRVKRGRKSARLKRCRCRWHKNGSSKINCR